jgi:cell wall-associated NlpC family hydrolase
MNFAIKYILVWLVAVFCFAFVSCDQKPVKESAGPSIPAPFNENQYVTPIPTPKPVEINFTQKDDVKLQELPPMETPQESPLPKLPEKVKIKGPGATVGETKNIKEVNPPILTAEIVTQKKVAEKPVIVEKVVAPVSHENLQAKIINVASKYIGEFESEGSNNSPFIRKINKFAGVPSNSYWCASFVNYVYYEAGIQNRPKGPAYSPSWFSNKYLISFKDLQKGDTAGFFFKNLDGGRIGHIAIYTGDQTSTRMRFIEGNTSPDAEVGEASRNGGNSGGVYSKLRSKKLLDNGKNKFSRWWDK